MAIVKMMHLTMIGMERDREALLQKLQRMACLHLSEPPESADAPWRELLHREDAAAAGDAADLRQVQSAIDVLKKTAPQKTGLLTPRPAISAEEFVREDTLRQDLELARQVNELAAEISRLHSREVQINADRASLKPWEALDIPLDMSRTGTVDITTGTVPGTVDFAAMQGAISECEAELYQLSASPEQQCLLLLSHRASTDDAVTALRSYGFSTGQLRQWQGTVQENMDRMARELEDTKKQRQEQEKALAALGEKQKELQLCADRLSTRLNTAENRHRLLTDDHVFCLQGWVPEYQCKALTSLLDSYDCAYDLAQPTDEDIQDVPVQLKGNSFTRSMNCITEQYSLPAYDGVDPNPVMAPFFIFFFGMMMADMAYGILMVLGSLMFLKKKRPADRSFMEMIFWCGISTFLFGAMTGGFLGDFIPQLLRIINPTSTFEMPALFTPLGDTMTIMLGSLVLGVIQIFTGMTISIVQKTKAGHFADALWDEITWWVVLAGVALMALKIGTVRGVPVVLVIGGLMLLYGSTRNAKGFGKVTGFISVIYNGVTGFFSDILSYVRLMALMLSGSVIAQVFNTLGATFKSVIPFIIVALIGNALNLALNLLGCYVHDMRLQFLEFFGRFYKDGGKAFNPLSLQSKNVEIIKEEQ